MSDLRGRELPWLYRTARNLAIDTHRRSVRLVPLAVEPEARESEIQSTPPELVKRMFATASGMGERYEILLHLILETSVSQTEMAGVLGVSERTVRRMAEHLKSALQTKIKDWKDFL